MQYDRQAFATAPDGTRLFYGVRGPRPDVLESGAAGPTWILSDGIGCDGFAWRYLQPHLAERHRVVHWHYRAHGRSGLPVDAARIDIPAHARDLLAVMDAAGIESAILAGHSMGTQVSLEAYRLAPDRVRGLALLCGSYGKITTTFHGSDVLKTVLPSIIDVVERNQGLARAVWGRIPPALAFRFAQLAREVDALAIREEDFRFYMEHVASMEPGIFFAMLRLAGEHTAEDVLERIHVPALVVAAERDTFTPNALAQHMADVIPGAEFFLLRGASHAAPVEQPVAVEVRIAKWLADRFAPQASSRREVG
ncbi:alpha/beta fold hydrolase [Sandaracinus amylolyticus]|uniref:Beta-ketoadipate enol-lactone hydrolase n=1 Tax=Sandaracinus amylolyticus TaxID=927083 RepID=A0A0F6W282_9BACT|nr:alpha/beta hydrolase [Sandaracinus amylolyticus]AKF05618.1 Beta-ketoadipate enol-lactone hydrolase [Sandaracinus amylolyticus]